MEERWDFKACGEGEGRPGCGSSVESQSCGRVEAVDRQQRVRRKQAVARSLISSVSQNETFDACEKRSMGISLLPIVQTREERSPLQRLLDLLRTWRTTRTRER